MIMFYDWKIANKINTTVIRHNCFKLIFPVINGWTNVNIDMNVFLSLIMNTSFFRLSIENNDRYIHDLENVQS